MEHSAEIGNIAKALVKVQAELKPVAKGQENPFYHSKYAGLPSIVEAATPILTKHGIAVVQSPSGGDGNTVGMTTMLIHESGEWIRETGFYPLAKSDPQGVGSAITYGRRYGLCAMVGIVADDDDDGNAATRGNGADKARPTLDSVLKEMAKSKTVQELTQTVRKYGQYAWDETEKARLNSEHKRLNAELNKGA